MWPSTPGGCKHECDRVRDQAYVVDAATDAFEYVEDDQLARLRCPARGITSVQVIPTLEASR